MKRVILDADNELFKKTEPVLIDIWCRGIVGAKLTSIVLTMLFSLLLSPIGWISAAARKIIHFIIFGGIWYFVQLYLSHYLNNLDLIILYIGIVFILYKDLYKEVVILIIHLITLITFGLFVQWIARGYLNHSDVCHRFLTMDVFLNIISTSPPFRTN